MRNFRRMLKRTARCNIGTNSFTQISVCNFKTKAYLKDLGVDDIVFI